MVIVKLNAQGEVIHRQEILETEDLENFPDFVEDTGQYPLSPNLRDLLAAARVQMASVIEGLTVEQQAKFEVVRNAVSSALDRGNVAVARQIIVDTPVHESLESTKADILALFPSP